MKERGGNFSLFVFFYIPKKKKKVGRMGLLSRHVRRKRARKRLSEGARGGKG